RGAPTPPTTGNLFVPVAAGTGTSGGWRERRPRRAAGPALAGLAVVGAAAWLTARARRRRH
ncbi:MAG TPA: hypothetical protein VHF69_00990, partial [Candidatus Synoicihabitans sp.]|nr:hypothetical protein [Candidatus Synoicihabitans sp.]